MRDLKNGLENFSGSRIQRLREARKYRHHAKVTYRVIKVSLYHNESYFTINLAAYPHRERLNEESKVALWIRSLRDCKDMKGDQGVDLAQVSFLRAGLIHSFKDL